MSVESSGAFCHKKYKSFLPKSLFDTLNRLSIDPHRVCTRLVVCNPKDPHFKTGYYHYDGHRSQKLAGIHATLQRQFYPWTKNKKSATLRATGTSGSLAAGSAVMRELYHFVHSESDVVGDRMKALLRDMKARDMLPVACEVTIRDKHTNVGSAIDMLFLRREGDKWLLCLGEIKCGYEYMHKETGVYLRDVHKKMGDERIPFNGFSAASLQGQWYASILKEFYNVTVDEVYVVRISRPDPDKEFYTTDFVPVHEAIRKVALSPLVRLCMKVSKKRK